MLMHKDLPNQRSVKKESSAKPQPKIHTVPEDFLTIRPDDSPGLKRLKRLISLDTTELEKFQEELKAEFFQHEIHRITRKTKTPVHIPIERELADFLSRQWEKSRYNEYVLPEAAEMYLNHKGMENRRVNAHAAHT